MKKIYLLAVTAMLAFSANAQFSDDLESYDLGPLEDGNWTGWAGLESDLAIVTATRSFDGAKSAVINTALQDALLLTGNSPASGTWTMSFKMYVPSNKSAYFNIQGSDVPGGAFLSGDIYFNAANGAPGLGEDLNANAPATFVFPHDAWFDVKLIVNMDAATYSIKIDNADSIIDSPFNAASTNFASIDLYYASDTDEYYIDAVNYAEGLLGADEFSADVFTVYPNPVVNTLNIKSASAVDNVTIYDVLGKEVLSVNPDAISPSVDMSNLTSGAYLVNVTIGNASKTIKVLK
ncbi:hypothetical protein SCB49_02169 [unidentified eubacterium SCB49]|nr:hypothetical protein SCB49_02169 [unidentified eubacterium SCB49]